MRAPGAARRNVLFAVRSPGIAAARAGGLAPLLERRLNRCREAAAIIHQQQVVDYEHLKRDDGRREKRGSLLDYCDVPLDCGAPTDCGVGSYDVGSAVPDVCPCDGCDFSL